MASIPQKSLFGWNQIENLGDLERLRLVLDALPDESRMRTLECKRGKGRDDYPIRPLFNSVLAGVVFEHVSIASLRRELLRNAQLRQVCGFDLLCGGSAVPPAYVSTRFLKTLMEHTDSIEAMFEELVDSLHDLLPGFGKTLAIDGKAIRTHARPRGKDAPVPGPDGRRDLDADFGVKTSRSECEDGTIFERVKKGFGYKIHLIVDASYELPVAFDVTRASASEEVVAHDLVDRIKKDHPDWLKTCETLTGDKGYDDSKLLNKLWHSHRIKPGIAIRDCWKDGEQTRRVDGTHNVVYDYQGTVYCHCPATGERRPMANGGYESGRDSLKYRWPARHYGIQCQGAARCPVGAAVRIKCAQEPRIFTPLSRSSYSWERAYKRRTSVERVNSRLDVSYGFERHYIRGLTKMHLCCGLALLVMLAMAVGRIKEKQKAKLCSLVAAA